MDFRQADEKFKQLKARYEAGELTEAEFKSQLQDLMVQDEDGAWWMIGYETERWYRHDGTDWVQADPRSIPSNISIPAMPLETTEGKLAASAVSKPAPAPQGGQRNWLLPAGIVGILLLAGGAFIALINRPTYATATVAPASILTEEAAGAAVDSSGTPIGTFIPTPRPTFTFQAPFNYTVAAGDSCSSIASAFGVSIQSIVILNDLPASCNNLFIGQILQVPYPTASAAPLLTGTPLAAVNTTPGCESQQVVVQENDTLASIALKYNTTMRSIIDSNGLSTDFIVVGQKLTILHCKDAGTPGLKPSADPSILFQDDFSSPNEGWAVVLGSPGEATFTTDGQYRLHAVSAHAEVLARPSEDFTDARIEVDATPRGGIGTISGKYGLVCRYQDEFNFYLVMIDEQKGWFWVGRRDGNANKVLVDWTKIPRATIYNGSATVHLRADCVGSTLTFYVNGEEQGSVTDSSLSHGSAGLIVFSADVPDAVFLFDNFVVYQP